MKESRFPWIAANVIDKKTGKPFGGAESFVIREFGGVKIGILGLVCPRRGLHRGLVRMLTSSTSAKQQRKSFPIFTHVAPKLCWL